MSKCFVWQLSAQTGEQYSYVVYTRARLEVQIVHALDPQLVPASFPMMFIVYPCLDLCCGPFLVFAACGAAI